MPALSSPSSGPATFLKSSFQVNQTLSAGGERHRGSFQGTLTSKGRAETNWGEDGFTRFPSHTSLCCVLRAAPELVPSGWEGFSLGIQHRHTSSLPGPGDQGPRRQQRTLRPQELGAERFSLPLPSSAPDTKTRVAPRSAYLQRDCHCRHRPEGGRAAGEPGAGRGDILTSVPSSQEHATFHTDQHGLRGLWGCPFNPS